MATHTSVTLARALTNTAAARHVRIGSDAVDAPSGVNKGDYLWFDREAMEVLDASVNPVRVLRGAAGTAVASHVVGTAGYSGPSYLYSTVDPTGIPPVGAPNPWINTREGRVWIAVGDESGPGTLQRFWQLQVIGPRVPGALGIYQPSVTTP